ncbi:XRE family transcriptional regulator [Stutzerimonas decontaminans]|uniref:XRE family transcriptional regulator n=2 Tax=Stutzerimonas TaxID=2901164 RepID=A0ABX4VXW1_9GAMM|nr:helix-turn-helix transcriptional regulator [Stutzerimonas decontaminans]AHY43724.1 Cro/Cl family transcriptional regulator [Stutzerimonas decontaminans]MCQ4245849.1 helix-turn-helix transcriptional regulator [Stutzerimonas decontaminans]MCW8156760.1 XRE family transcriptional regulator [Stutzerimonas stutzeri]PNF84773.1 XRE family transcriptional regulator [Stutzerimonas decontaminans]
MNVQVIMRDGSPEYAVLPWDEYQALLSAVGVQPAARAPSVPDALPRPSLSQMAPLRENKGLSLEALARAVGISPAYLGLIEAGEREPDAAIRRALARALEIAGWEGDA